MVSQTKFKYADLRLPNLELTRQLAVPNPVGLRGIDAQSVLFVLFVFAVISVEREDPRVAFERQDVRRDAIEKPAIVRDHDRAAREILQRFFQRAQRVDIEIVGRLVEKEHVRAFLQHLREMNAVAFAARQNADLFLLILSREIESRDVRA